MQLTVPEAAHLLQVSEDTVYRWIKERGLPASQFEGRFHFNKMWLLEWAHEKGIPLAAEEDEGLPALSDALAHGGVHFDIPGNSIAAVLRACVDCLPLPPDVDRDYLFEMLLLREHQGSTGFGGGIALPHAREPILLHVAQPLVALCYLREPVDFAAVDGKPVTALFVQVTPTIRTHLHLLSQLGRMLNNPDFCGLIADRVDLQRLLTCIQSAQSGSASFRNSA